MATTYDAQARARTAALLAQSSARLAKNRASLGTNTAANVAATQARALAQSKARTEAASSNARVTAQNKAAVDRFNAMNKAASDRAAAMNKAANDRFNAMNRQTSTARSSPLVVAPLPGSPQEVPPLVVDPYRFKPDIDPATSRSTSARADADTSGAARDLADLPNINIPSPNVSSNLPSFDVSSNLPSFDVSSNLPSFDMSFSLPQVELPQINFPDLPGFSLPKVNLPSVNLPDLNFGQSGREDASYVPPAVRSVQSLPRYVSSTDTADASYVAPAQKSVQSLPRYVAPEDNVDEDNAYVPPAVRSVQLLPRYVAPVNEVDWNNVYTPPAQKSVQSLPRYVAPEDNADGDNAYVPPAVRSVQSLPRYVAPTLDVDWDNVYTPPAVRSVQSLPRYVAPVEEEDKKYVPPPVVSVKSLPRYVAPVVEVDWSSVGKKWDNVGQQWTDRVNEPYHPPPKIAPVSNFDRLMLQYERQNPTPKTVTRVATTPPPAAPPKVLEVDWNNIGKDWEKVGEDWNDMVNSTEPLKPPVFGTPKVVAPPVVVTPPKPPVVEPPSPPPPPKPPVEPPVVKPPVVEPPVVKPPVVVTPPKPPVVEPPPPPPPPKPPVVTPPTIAPTTGGNLVPIKLAEVPGLFGTGTMLPRNPVVPRGPVAPGPGVPDYSVPIGGGVGLLPIGGNVFEDEVLRRRVIGTNPPTTTPPVAPPITPDIPRVVRGSGSLDPHTLGSYKKLSDTFGTARDRLGNAVAAATLPTVDEVREGQLTAQIAGGNSQLSDVLGTSTDRFGNVIAAPAMPKFFEEGGEAVSNDTLIADYMRQENSSPINIDPLGTAQKYLTDVAAVANKPSPVRQLMKRGSRTSGGSESSKEMNLKLDPIADTKQMTLDTTSSPPEAKNTDSARAQMEAFIQQFQRKIEAAKNKSRGLRANTLGAPTLEAPTLTRSSLSKNTFAEGGEVKEPSIFGLSSYATKASAGMFPDQLGQDDQRDAARHMLAAGTVARKYGPKAAELLGKLHEYTSNPQTFFSAFGIGQPRDDLPYDVHNNRIGAELAARTTSQAELEKLVKSLALQSQDKQTKDKPYIMSREQMDARKAKAGKGMAPPPEYAKGGPVKKSKK